MTVCKDKAKEGRNLLTEVTFSSAVGTNSPSRLIKLREQRDFAGKQRETVRQFLNFWFSNLMFLFK